MFLSLPEKVVMHLPNYLDSAVLSGFAFERRQRGSTIFSVSVETIAKKIYNQWGLSENLSRFILEVFRSTRRLIALNFLKQVSEKEWIIHVNLEVSIDWLNESKDLDAIVTCKSLEAWKDQDGFIDCINRSRGLHLNTFYKAFVEIQTQSNLHTRRGTGEWSIIPVIARRGTSGSRHASVGSFSKRKQDNLRHTIPNIILDFDAPDTVDAFDDCRRAVESLNYYRRNGDPFFVCFTGNRGFHIHIPSGLVGNPVFYGNYTDSESYVWASIKDACDETGIDKSLLNPSHMYRLTGSVHEKSGRYKTPFTFDEFMSLSLEDIMKQSTEHKPFDIGDPFDTSPNPELVNKLVNKDVGIPSFDETPELGEGEAVITTIKRGVSEGEQWGAKFSHVGRNKAAFVYACYLIRKYGMGSLKSVESDLVEWNKLNDPPLNTNEIGNCFASAMRAVRRNKNNEEWK